MCEKFARYLFVSFAVRSDGKPITLIVNSNSLKAVEFEGAQRFIGKATGVVHTK